MQPLRDKCVAERFLRKLFKAPDLKFKTKGSDEPGLCGWVVASHIHIAHATHAAATAALVVLGQFGNHPGGRKHQSCD
jgi:hypothetical protein